jgi:hypothetical protein
VLGPDSTVTSDGFTTIALTAQTQEGEAISVTNAAGKVCVSDTPAPQFTGYQVSVTFCQVDPQMFTLMTGQPVVLSDDGTDVVGFDMNSDVDLDGSGFALEVWSSVPTASCGETGDQGFGYFLLPFLQGGVLGDFTIENAAITFTIQNAATKDGTPWGVGPYNVVKDSSDADSKLNTALTDTNHLHMELTTVAPPAAAGAVALGVPATLITAGIPATLTPANSYAPANLANLITLAPTKTPTTAWTTGQYVLLRDGSKAHWSSSAWIAGPA